MSMKDAKASNWVAEIATPTSSGFNLKGSSKGYTTFARAFSATQEVFYSAHDDNGNREAGYAQFDGSNLILRRPTATLTNGAYSSGSPPKMAFVGDVTVACTFNAVAFNTLWSAFDQIDPDGDGNINIPPELIGGLVDALRNKADQVDLEKEIEDRIAGDEDLQDQIDGLAGGGVGGGMIISDSEPSEDERVNGTMWLDTTTGIVWIWDEDKWLEFPAGGAGGAGSWDELTGKPTEFPPSSHTHAIKDVDGLEDQLSDIESSIGAIAGQLALGASYDASTGLIVHGHIPGFEDGQPLPAYADHQDVFVIVSVAGSNPEELSEGDWLVAGPSGWLPIKYGTAGTVDWSNVNNAPEFIEDVDDDGKTYIRTYGAWQEVTGDGIPTPSWDSISDKPDTFTPSAHTHEIAEVNSLQDALDANAAGVEANADEIEKHQGYIDTNIANIAVNAQAITEKLDADTIWTGTQDEYDALTPDAETLYFIV